MECCCSAPRFRSTLPAWEGTHQPHTAAAIAGCLIKQALVRNMELGCIKRAQQQFAAVDPFSMSTLPCLGAKQDVLLSKGVNMLSGQSITLNMKRQGHSQSQRGTGLRCACDLANHTMLQDEQSVNTLPSAPLCARGHTSHRRPRWPPHSPGSPCSSQLAWHEQPEHLSPLPSRTPVSLTESGACVAS